MSKREPGGVILYEATCLIPERERARVSYAEARKGRRRETGSATLSPPEACAPPTASGSSSRQFELRGARLYSFGCAAPGAKEER